MLNLVFLSHSSFQRRSSLVLKVFPKLLNLITWEALYQLVVPPEMVLSCSTTWLRAEAFADATQSQQGRGSGWLRHVAFGRSWIKDYKLGPQQSSTIINDHQRSSTIINMDFRWIIKLFQLEFGPLNFGMAQKPSPVPWMVLR